jgi:hypothetical protein
VGSDAGEKGYEQCERQADTYDPLCRLHFLHPFSFSLIFPIFHFITMTAVFSRCVFSLLFLSPSACHSVA